MKDTLTRKQKIYFWSFMFILVLIIAAVVFYIVKTLNPPAHLGSMTVSSGGKTITAYRNVERETENNVVTNYRSVDVKEIADELPTIAYDGYDLSIGFAEDYDILDDFLYDMYDEDFNRIYFNREGFRFPTEPGTYIVRAEFSWGYTKKNSILTENLFKLYLSEASLKTE